MTLDSFEANYSLEAEAWGLSLLILFFAVVLSMVRRYARVGDILLLGFALRTLTALVNHYAFPLPDSQSDALVFEERAAWLSRQPLRLSVTPFPIGGQLYATLLSLIYRLAVRSPLAGEAFNVGLGSFIILGAYLLAREFGSEKQARRAATIVAIFPTLILYSSVLLREAIVVCFLIFGMLCSVRFLRRQRIGHAILGSGLLLAAAAFHPIAIVPLPIIAVATVFTRSSQFRRMGTRLAGIAFGLVGFSLLAIDPALIARFDLASLAVQQEILTAGRQPFPPWTTVSGSDILWKLPVRCFLFLVGPPPWSIFTLEDVIGAVDGALYASLIVTLLSRPGTGVGRGFVAVAVVAMIAILALGVSNYGTAVRHRAKVFPLLVALLARRHRTEECKL